MKIKTIQAEIEIYASKAELEREDLQLLERAEEAREMAYAPYSNFKVGAAVLLENGTIVIGNNQENAAYPSGLCAERVAVYAAAAQHPLTRIMKIAITAEAPTYTIMQPVAPCGACRQSILEYELQQQSDIVLLLHGEKGEVYRIKGLKQLLPLYFGQESILG
ncbi:MAG TPA: cytidine deaminase [Flavobacteriales bacterium]|jgi:cytidine deaminase